MSSPARTDAPARPRSWVAAAVCGAVAGALGGLIGLGGAEFRLPLPISLFGFLALQAVIMNKAMSLLVVATALPARLAAVPITGLIGQWPVVATGYVIGPRLTENSTPGPS